LNQPITQRYFTDQPYAWPHAQNAVHKSHGARREFRGGKKMQFIALDFKGHHGKLPGLTTCDNTHVPSAMIHDSFFGAFSLRLYMQSKDFINIPSIRVRAA